MSTWPFKHIKQKSAWPLHGLVVSLASAALQMPAGKLRREFLEKNTSRLYRAVGRIAVEFDLDPVNLMKSAREELIREYPAAAAKLKEADVNALDAKLGDAKALVAEAFDFSKLGLPSPTKLSASGDILYSKGKDVPPALTEEEQDKVNEDVLKASLGILKKNGSTSNAEPDAP